MPQNSKKCRSCKNIKTLDAFGKMSRNKSKIEAICKICKAMKAKNYHRTKKGLITNIYIHQCKLSAKRGYSLPDYTSNELREVLLSNPSFHKLFKKWEDNLYNKQLAPSMDRINDYKPYTMDNIQLMTWKENREKASNDRKNGKNNKVNKAVLKLDINLNIIEEYHSASEAGRKNKIDRSWLSTCCRNTNYKAGGFFWRYKKENKCHKIR